MNEQKNALPALSHGNIHDGMWYVFNDAYATIRAWGSSWTGIERVYYNDILIQRTSNGCENDYCFHQGEHEYRLLCKTTDLRRWQVECELWKDNQLTQVVKFKRRKLFNARPTLLHLCLGLIIGQLSGLFQMPWLFGLVFIFAALTATILTTIKADDFVLEYERI
jgi:hypothetical protein